MSFICNDSTEFADESAAGFVAANRTFVRAVSGGVVRRRKAKLGEVVVIIGGGSGHYPAFAGLVGFGMAHGAAMGNVFASPSAQQIYNVAKIANAGGGILFAYGNYAGDVLNFDLAQERLRSEGIDVRTVVVTDDIASAPSAEKFKRRGIAGDLPVFKAACAAAEKGSSIDEVYRIACEANERVRTLGVAFSGCTLPGASCPLFKVNAGTMEVGMGIHGEPGLYKMDIPSADELAEILVGKLMEEIPSGVEVNKARVGVILNGLGSVKYEELFVVFRKVDALLASRGIVIVDPEVGELVTSFEMAGVSLTLFWLNEELERTWLSPVHTPAFRKGSIESDEGEEGYLEAINDPNYSIISRGSKESRECAKVVFKALQAVERLLENKCDELGHLDAVAGDGDHGIGMLRGAKAAVVAAETSLGEGAGVGSVLIAGADAWSDSSGGTSGVIWGAIFRELGEALGDIEVPDTESVAVAVAVALSTVMALGKAQVGDKTLVDTLSPFSKTLSECAESGDGLATAWRKASTDAFAAAVATKGLLPAIGRARPHAEKSLGNPDPGAMSMAWIIEAIEPFLKN